MTRFLTLSLAGCLTLAWSVGEAQTTAKPYAYNMKTTVSRPAGSAAEAAFKIKTNPTTTVLTSCVFDIRLKQDMLSFLLVYDAGKRSSKPDKNGVITDTVTNVYFFFYNPEALGLKPPSSPPILGEHLITTPLYPELCETGKVGSTISYHACDPKIWVLDRPAVGLERLAMRPLADASAIRPTDIDHIYLADYENLGTGKITDTMLRSYMRFDDLPQGLWSLVGIIGPKIDPDPTVIPTPVDFNDPSTWAAWDSVTFMLGSPWANGNTCD